MRDIFIGVVVITLVANVIWFCMPFLWAHIYETEVLDALSWNGYGAQLDMSGPIPYIFLAVFGIISIGLIYFKRWARTGFVAYIIVSILLAPLLGLYVQTGIESLISYIIALGDGAILMMLFLTSISDEFKSTT